MDSDHEGHFEWAFGDILRSSPFFSNFVHFFHSHLTLVSFISEILLFYVQLSLLYSLSIRFIIRYKMLCSMVFSLFIFNGFMFFSPLLWTVVNEVQCFHQNKCTFYKTAIQWFVILFAIWFLRVVYHILFSRHWAIIKMFTNLFDVYNYYQCTRVHTLQSQYLVVYWYLFTWRK